jgi:Domain of unknown function (DUF4833)
MRRRSRHLLIMLTRRALPLWLAAVAVESYAPRELHALPSRELFTLGRSKNANVVKYAVRLGRDGQLDLAAPVEAYWLMLAEDGRREELTWTERQLAYGFSVSSPTREGFLLHLAACSTRVLRVSAAQGGFRAQLAISGQAAYLRRIFVRTDEGLLMPSVRYIEISGLTAAGQSVSERVLPR